MENNLKERRVRNLTKTLAVVSLLAPVSGYSLGIGDIKLHSALNQNLDAEISLVVSAGEKASDIKVNLAPPDKFDEAGVPWASFLSKIKFSTIVRPNGSLIIKLSSREAVKEPFLDLLLEVSWPKGSLYREFTVLLDPPAVYKHATAPVLTDYENYEPERAFIQQRQPKQRPQRSAGDSVSGASEYGPTQRNDTLWKIAERASRQEGVSVEQMMIAMYEKNPRAFYKENVHALLAGKKLKIPEREVVLKFSRKQALAEYNRQTKTWKNRLAPAPVETVTDKKDTPDNQLTLVAPTQADVAEKATITPENEQVTAKKKADDVTAKTVEKEAVSTVNPVNDAIQAKVAELEKQLAMMQQIIALKDQQLAALQNQLQTKPAVQPENVQTTPPEQPGTVANPVIQQKPAIPEIKPAIKPEPLPESSSYSDYLWIGGFGGGILSLLGWLWWRKHKLEVQTDNESLFTSLIMGEKNESKGFVSSSSEKDSVENVDAEGKSSFLNELTFGDFDSFDTAEGEIDPVSEADVYLAYGRYQQAEELMRDVIKDQPGRDDCKLKLLEIFYSSQNKQAFETYANELAQAGKKDDLGFWAKVTAMGSEICQDATLFSSQVAGFSSKDNSDIEKEAPKLVESNNVEKNEVNEVKENNLNLSSFGEKFDIRAVKETPEKAESLLDFDLISFKDEGIVERKNNESIDFDFEKKSVNLFKSHDIEKQEMTDHKDNISGLSTFGESLNNESVKELRPNKDSLLDFDLSFFEDEAIDEQKNNESIDFDLSNIAPKIEESNDSHEKVVNKLSNAQVNDEFESFNFDFSSNEIEAKGINDIDNYEFTDSLTDNSSALNVSLADDTFDRNFNLDRPKSELNEQEIDQEDGLDVYDLTDMDELETKLDLAKAYIDMSDMDAAKDMAYEVLEKGTAEQKKIAQALLNDLE